MRKLIPLILTAAVALTAAAPAQATTEYWARQHTKDWLYSQYPGTYDIDLGDSTPHGDGQWDVPYADWNKVGYTSYLCRGKVHVGWGGNVNKVYWSTCDRLVPA